MQIKSLAPFMDQNDGLIKCGGRLAAADLTFARKHPTLIPDTETGNALIGYIHASLEHPGRKITTGEIRRQGYHAIGGKRRIDRIIRICTYCRKLRAAPMTQKMADLPIERL